MNLEDFRAAIAAAPGESLGALAQALWAAVAAGTVGESEAEALAAVLDARRSPGTVLGQDSHAEAPTGGPRPRRTAPRPRTPDSLARRRRWAAAGRLPPALAARFTQAEQAVLAVLAVQVERHGACTLPLDALAALAGVSRTLVRNALREARCLGLVTVEERRRSRWRNDTNVVRIVSREWASWIARRGLAGHSGGGRTNLPRTNTRNPEQGFSQPAKPGRLGSRRATSGSKMRVKRLE